MDLNHVVAVITAIGWLGIALSMAMLAEMVLSRFWQPEIIKLDLPRDSHVDPPVAQKIAA